MAAGTPLALPTPGEASRHKGQRHQEFGTQSEPGLADAHFNLGIVLTDKGLLDEAIACYREAIRLKEDYPDAYVGLGNAVRDKGQVPTGCPRVFCSTSLSLTITIRRLRTSNSP
jgi:tetratricopeptide (TPR) repeat protein